MSKHILVVDDSVSIRQMVEMTLKGAGYTVTTAQDGQEAFDKCKSLQQAGWLRPSSLISFLT